jgi:hypothetical protein
MKRCLRSIQKLIVIHSFHFIASCFIQHLFNIQSVSSEILEVQPCLRIQWSTFLSQFNQRIRNEFNVHEKRRKSSLTGTIRNTGISHVIQ